MKLKIGSSDFNVVDTLEKVTIADSFVVRQNKIGIGNGEAKLYVGQSNEQIRAFFGDIGFDHNCFLLKSDLIKYLDQTKAEYLMPQQKYQQKDSLPTLWQSRKDRVAQFPENIEFTIYEKTDLTGPRVYVHSTDDAYKLIRELSLPNITFISIVKLLDPNNKLKYYFRLFADYFGESEHPYQIQKDETQIIESSNSEREKKQLIMARLGQGAYRQKLLLDCPFCPITLVGDNRLLNASHIKPWAISNDFEKIDSKNGFMLTPTIDRLFDRGFLSFSEDKRTMLSPFLSNITYSKLGISDNKLVPYLPIVGRENYLDYHRQQVLKK